LERLDQLEQRLFDQGAPGGGWPHSLRVDRAALSLVGTAHAVAMLRMRGYEHTDKRITKGLHYLAVEVREQLKPGGRGVYSRYPAYALWGLMRFPNALYDPAIFDSAKFSANWLVGRARPSGGWTVDGAPVDDSEVSLPATMAAVHGLDRMSPYVRGKLGAQYAAAAEAARDAVVEQAIKSGEGSCWRQLAGAPICPGATSLAVLTLAGGSERHREYARRGIQYLTDHPDWTNAVHPDEQLEKRMWHIMTFSLGLRAILHPCAANRPSDKVIKPVLRHFDALWDEKAMAFAVAPGREGSTTGSYAVLAAIRALKNASSFDPWAEYRIKRSAAASSAASRAAARKVSVRRVTVAFDKRAIRVWDGNTEREFRVVWSDRADSQWRMLVAMLKRRDTTNKKLAQRESVDQGDYALSLRELAAFTNDGDVKRATINQTIRRINLKVGDAAGAQGIRNFPALVEDIEIAESSELGYGLEDSEISWQTEPQVQDLLADSSPH
jgi:hypothetical protein